MNPYLVAIVAGLVAWTFKYRLLVLAVFVFLSLGAALMVSFSVPPVFWWFVVSALSGLLAVGAFISLVENS